MYLVPKSASLCLGIAGKSTAAGASLVQQACTAADGRRFRLTQW